MKDIIDAEYKLLDYTPILLPNNKYTHPSLRYTTVDITTTEDPSYKFIVNGIEWIFQNPEKAFALAAGIAATVIVYKIVTSRFCQVYD